MKYQKSMMKIMETLLKDREGKVIENLIRESGTGRNSSFEAIRWLEKTGFVIIETSGKQKIVKLNLDNFSLQYKFYLDSIEFKLLDPFVKMVLKILISQFKSNKIKGAVLFGSVLNKSRPLDLDILFLGDGLTIRDLDLFSGIKERIERVFGIILNFHRESYTFENLFRGIVIYQISYFKEQNKAQRAYLEFIEFTFDSIKNQREKLLFDISFQNAILNLAFSYCYSKKFEPKTKYDAINFFEKKFKIKNLQKLKEKGVEIGKKIFF